MAKLKKIVIALVVLASAIALYAFFSSDFKEDTAPINNEEVFLKHFNNPNFELAEVARANMLGEPFNLTVRVQYYPENIEIFPESLDYADYAPFEPTGNKVVKTETLEHQGREIGQLTYSVELIAIQAISGQSYKIPEMNLEFLRKNSKIKSRHSINIAPDVEISVGSYWGGNYEGATLSPLKGKILSALDEKQALYLASAGMLLLAAVAIGGSWALANVKEGNKHKPVLGSKHQLYEIFRKYEDLNWLSDKDAPERMHELENLVVHMAVEYSIVRNASDFWEKDDNESWLKMTRCLNGAYSKDGTNHQEVLRAASLAKELIVKHILPKKEKTIGRTVFSRSN